MLEFFPVAALLNWAPSTNTNENFYHKSRVFCIDIQKKQKQSPDLKGMLSFSLYGYIYGMLDAFMPNTINFQLWLVYGDNQTFS